MTAVPASARPANAITVLRDRFSVLAVVAATAVAVLVTFSYLYGFLDPDGNVRDLPIGLVVEDTGATVGGRSVSFGELVATSLTDADQGTVAWVRLPDRAAALAELGDNDLVAAVVVPAGYSTSIVALADPRAPLARPAQIDVLTNPSAGAYASAAGERAGREAVAAVATRTRDALASQLAAAGVSFTADKAQVLAQPVQPAVTAAQPLIPKAGRGLAAFYFAVTITIGAYLSASIVDLGMDYITGRQEFRVFGRRLARPPLAIAERRLWLAKLLGVATAVVLGSVLSTWMAVGVLGMGTSSAVGLALYAMLGMAAIAAITLLLLTAFGIPGAVAAVLFTTILGVPAAGGVYPFQAMPGLFRFLSGFMPLRYLTDGARSIMWFDGRGGAGLTAGVAVLAAYTVIGVAVSGGLAATFDRRHAAGSQPAAAPTALQRDASLGINEGEA